MWSSITSAGMPKPNTTSTAPNASQAAGSERSRMPPRKRAAPISSRAQSTSKAAALCHGRGRSEPDYREGHATRQVPRSRGRCLAPRRGAADRRRARDASTASVVTDPARDVDDAQRGRGRRRRRSGPSRSSTTASTSRVGVVSTAHDPGGRPKVIDLVDSSARLYPVGRLDADSSGLILLTNDGELANRLMHPRYEVEKTYRVRVSGHALEGRRSRALRQGSSWRTGRPRPRGSRRSSSTARETVLEIDDPRGPQARWCGGCCEAVGHPGDRARADRPRAARAGPPARRRIAAAAPARRSTRADGALQQSRTVTEGADSRLHALRGAISVERNDGGRDPRGDPRADDAS